MDKLFSGDFEVTSGYLAISDPSYADEEIKVSDGTWTWFYDIEEPDCYFLVALRKESQPITDWEPFSWITVDSGHVSIFDKGYSETFFAQTSTEEGWNLHIKSLFKVNYQPMPQGVIASTGVGDGVFPVDSLLSQEGVVVGVRITLDPMLFLTSED